MKGTLTYQILKNLYSNESKMRKTSPRAIALLDRRAAERMFKNRFENTSSAGFNGTIMRTVRSLKDSMHLTKRGKGIYALSNYGRRMISK
jgi:hypothetical protein